MLDLFIFCAEKSGDSLGYNYIQKVLKKNPSCRVSGVLGPKLSTLKIDKFMDIKRFSVMGFIPVLKKIFTLVKAFYSIKKRIIKTAPKTVLLIDAPDLTLRLARSLKKSGFKGHIIQYVCPSIWAWRSSRKKLIDQYIDELLCLLPFEPSLFHSSNTSVKLVNHPIIEEIDNYKYPFSLKELEGKKILLILPGSRAHEIKQNLPLQLEAAKEFQDLSACILVSHAKHLITITKILIKHKSSPFLIEPNAKFDIMKKAHIALAKCGSSNLELALHKIPSVIMYNPNKIDKWMVKYIFNIKIKKFSLPNIILNKSIYKEHITDKVTKEKLVHSIQTLLKHSTYEDCKKNCKELIDYMKSSCIA